MIGYYAMLNQLVALKLLKEPLIQKSSEFFSNFIEMYNKMGDSISLQYGGSIAHRQGKSKGLGLGEYWTSFKRHINNVVQDPGKQRTINLFLGVFIPSESSEHLWKIDDTMEHPVQLIAYKDSKVNPLNGNKWYEMYAQDYENSLPNFLK